MTTDNGANAFTFEYTDADVMQGVQRSMNDPNTWFALRGTENFILESDHQLPEPSKRHYGLAIFEGSKAEWVETEGGVLVPKTLAVPHFELNIYRILEAIVRFSTGTKMVVPDYPVEDYYTGLFRLLALNIFDGSNKHELYGDKIFYIRTIAYCEGIGRLFDADDIDEVLGKLK
ncbi:hypothetical protein HY570_00170, partial [Candidatus Micrarchaeota archaeon]|nr:hypothetical protein [Candidatus Micrarchaeota archaeon]